MEPIRPDDDELRRGPVAGQTDKKAPETAGRPTEKPPQQGGSGHSGIPKPSGSGVSGGKGSVLLVLLLLVVAGLLGFGWWQQERRIEALEGQVEEADYWVRQSKLALARFEGELSETGESLQQKGESIEDTLASHQQRLDTADSEIRKLWVVSNERNRQRLNDHESRLEALREAVDAGTEGRERLRASLEELESSLTSELAAVEQSLEQRVAEVRSANEQIEARLVEVSEAVDGVDQVIDSRLRRFEQEQKLGISGLESRVGALETRVNELSEDDRYQQLRNQLARLKETVGAIDASRAQITSRLVRLSEEVDDLQARVAGQ